MNLGHACAAAEYVDHAESLERILAPVAHLHAAVPGAVLYCGSVAAAQAALLEQLDRKDEAVAAYRAAVAAETKVGARRYAATSAARLERLQA